MRAGRLRQSAAIRRATVSRSESGAAVESWTDHVSGWPCEIATVRGGEQFRGRQVHASADHMAIGRYVSGVTPQMRVALLGREYEVVAVEDVEMRRRELRLHLREVGA